MKKLFTLAVAIALCSTMGFAQGLGLKGVGGSVGYTSVSFGLGSESFGGFVIGAHADMGEISPGFQVLPELQYWSTSKDVGGASWKVSDFAINANVHYNIQTSGDIKPYVGAGLGMNFISFTWGYSTPAYTFFGQTYGGSSLTSESATRLGINLLGGANFATGNITISPEVRYVVASDFNHFIVKVGVTVPLGK
ncbi:MAG TPA: outer membrane beta-barrel protein [Bacteroidota bacterium]|nr:outer membrane beta-barrel protein [Bacteroidota bacterium]